MASARCEFKIPTNLEELEEGGDGNFYQVQSPLEVKVMPEKQLADLLDEAGDRIANTQVDTQVSDCLNCFYLSGAHDSKL